MHASSPREHTARPERRAWPPRPAAGGLLPLLREADFRRYWTAATVSILGDQVSDVAVPLTAVLLLRAAASDVSHLSALEWLPSLLLGLHAGAWADRVGRRRAIMVAADLGRFGLLASVPAAALGVLTLPQLYLVMFAVGAL